VKGATAWGLDKPFHIIIAGTGRIVASDVECHVAFFPLVDPPTPNFDGTAADPPPWEDGFGRSVFRDVMLARGSEGAVLLRNVVAYPSVMALSVIARLRHPLVQGPGTRGHNCPTFSNMGEESVKTGIVLFGLRFSDGSSYHNLAKRGSEESLQSLGGGANAYRGEHEFVAGLPPEGDLEIWVAWPAVAIPETRTVLEGAPIREAASSLRSLWA
jgi:hypothetical protein